MSYTVGERVKYAGRVYLVVADLGHKVAITLDAPMVTTEVKAVPVEDLER